jgi:hypothetical protein
MSILNEELQNLITWCFKWYINFTDYVDPDWHCSCFNCADYIPFNAVAFLVTSFQFDQQAVHMVCCTGSTRWREHKPQWKHTVLLWKGRSPDSHCKLTAGCIPVQ